MNVIGIYHQLMQTGSRIGISMTAGLAAAVVGGCIGFIVSRILVDGVGIVEGPPAGVLLVLLVGFCAVLGGVFGFVLSHRWLRGHPPGRQ